VFGGALRRVYPLAQIGGFEDLLNAIDEADHTALPGHNRTVPPQTPCP
jgi:hypothetical protein